MKVSVDKVWKGDDIKVRANKVSGASAFELGLIVASNAKQLCPVNFGQLAASITVQAFSKGTNPDSPSLYRKADPTGKYKPYTGKKVIDAPTDPKEVLVGTPVDYAPHVEFGTVKMGAQPYLRPAFDIAKGKALAVVQKEGKYYFGEYLKQHEEYLKLRGVKE